MATNQPMATALLFDIVDGNENVLHSGLIMRKADSALCQEINNGATVRIVNHRPAPVSKLDNPIIPVLLMLLVCIVPGIVESIVI